MEVNNSGTVRFSLASRRLLATAVIVAVISCCGARAALEAGNATILWRCHGGECLIAYQQPEVELMAVPHLEQSLAGKPGIVAARALNKNSGGCGRTGPGRRYTPCTPPKNPAPRSSPYLRKG